MLQLENDAPFPAEIVVLPDQHGVDTLYVTCKATFTIGGPGEPLALAEEQVGIKKVDEYEGEAGVSSLRYPAELHLAKPATDVIMVGHAYAPRGRPVPEVLVTLSIGRVRKVVRVLGDRVAPPGGLAGGAPRPASFVAMPLVYERAFGGTVAAKEAKAEVTMDTRNPVGVGFGGAGNGRLPNLEDPTTPFVDFRDKSVPTGFGAIAPSWSPRRERGGTFDAEWKRKRAPFLPLDFDVRFFCMASSGLTIDGLNGGEPMDATGVTPEAPVSFCLPSCSLSVRVSIARREESLLARPETVIIEPDEKRVCVVWRAQRRSDRDFLEIDSVAVGVDTLEFPRRRT